VPGDDIVLVVPYFSTSNWAVMSVICCGGIAGKKRERGNILLTRPMGSRNHATEGPTPTRSSQIENSILERKSLIESESNHVSRSVKNQGPGRRSRFHRRAKVFVGDEFNT